MAFCITLKTIFNTGHMEEIVTKTVLSTTTESTVIIKKGQKCKT